MAHLPVSKLYQIKLPEPPSSQLLPARLVPSPPPTPGSSHWPADLCNIQLPLPVVDTVVSQTDDPSCPHHTHRLLFQGGSITSPAAGMLASASVRQASLRKLPATGELPGPRSCRCRASAQQWPLVQKGKGLLLVPWQTSRSPNCAAPAQCCALHSHSRQSESSSWRKSCRQTSVRVSVLGTYPCCSPGQSIL